MTSSKDCPCVQVQLLTTRCTMYNLPTQVLTHLWLESGCQHLQQHTSRTTRSVWTCLSNIVTSFRCHKAGDWPAKPSPPGWRGAGGFPVIMDDYFVQSERASGRTTCKSLSLTDDKANAAEGILLSCLKNLYTTGKERAKNWNQAIYKDAEKKANKGRKKKHPGQVIWAREYPVHWSRITNSPSPLFAETVNYPEQHLVCTKLKGLFVLVLGVLANDVWGKIISLFV